MVEDKNRGKGRLGSSMHKEVARLGYVEGHLVFIGPVGSLIQQSLILAEGG